MHSALFICVSVGWFVCFFTRFFFSILATLCANGVRIHYIDCMCSAFTLWTHLWKVNYQQLTATTTHQNPSFSRLSIEHAAAIRIPSSFMTAARSIPLSSANSICRKSPTLCDTGRSANWHFSFRLGNGTVTCGNPLIYLIVTSVNKPTSKQNE